VALNFKVLLFMIDRMEGRDIGKLRKHGYFSGTKANIVRYQIIGLVLFVSFGIGGLRM